MLTDSSKLTCEAMRLAVQSESMNLHEYMKKIPWGKKLQATDDLARICGVSVREVYYWITGERSVPPKKAPLIEKATRHRVTRSDLWETKK